MCLHHWTIMQSYQTALSFQRFPSLLCPKPPPFLPQRCQTQRASTCRVFGASWASSGPFCSLCRLAATSRSSVTSASSVTSERAQHDTQRVATTQTLAGILRCAGLHSSSSSSSSYIPSSSWGQKSRTSFRRTRRRDEKFALEPENLTTFHLESPLPSFHPALKVCFLVFHAADLCRASWIMLSIKYMYIIHTWLDWLALILYRRLVAVLLLCH